MSKQGQHQDAAGRDLAGELAWSMVLFSRKIDDYADEDIYLTGLSVRTPWAGHEDFLVILRANVGGEAKVAFSSGNTFWEAMKTAGDSFVNRSLKWKADEYAR